MYYFFLVVYFLKLLFNLGILLLFYLAFEDEIGQSPAVDFAIGVTREMGFVDRWDPEMAGRASSSFVMMSIVNFTVLAFLFRRKGRFVIGTIAFEILYGFLIGMPIVSIVLFAITFTDRFKIEFGLPARGSVAPKEQSWNE